jgi:hypothetical protein
LRVAQLLQDVGPQIVSHQIGVPGCATQQTLHPIGSAFSSVFSQLPTIFTLDGTHDPLQIGQRSTTGFRADKAGSNAGMQAFEFLPPPPDFDKGGLRFCWGDLLGVLHVFLLSHEAFFRE